MFDLSLFDGGNWAQVMANAVVTALATGDRVVMLTRRLEGRNLVIHATGHCTLDEIIRWMLYVQPAGQDIRRVPCVHHERNLQEEWTTRLDWRLPGSGRQATHPYCPPDLWEQKRTRVRDTRMGKPAWIDRHGNGWAKPDIPGVAYHWDVLIGRDDHLNVTAYDAPPSQGAPGTIHHVPEKEKSRSLPAPWIC
ncbi:MAG: hypothetical protein HQM03_18425 [Magnetococcales bacterium]|nr:hypothetical protein [Magnetococcales bacterium]